MITGIIFGGSGYVGGHLVEELTRRGHRAVVVTRPSAAPRKYAGVALETATDEELARLRGERCVVINLAFPRSVPGLEIRAANERLLARITRAVEATGAERLIHASTQAVFGYEWREPPRPGPAPLRLGDSYMESKRHAEDALRRHWRARGRRHDLAIVRLGNILGAAAVPWVAGMAQRILEGRSAAARDGAGALNGTYVRNIADYFVTLAEQGRVESANVHHHLAEFATHRWRDLIEPMSRAIGVRALYRPDAPVAKRAGPREWAASAARRFGATLRDHPSALAVVQRVRPAPPVSARGAASEDDGWYIVTAGTTPLPPALLAGWIAPHSFETMLGEIEAWLPAAGFTLEQNRSAS